MATLTKQQIDAMCPCPGCPTFVECGKKSFCIDGKSKCIKKKRGCLCPGCPVQNKMNFKHDYYCLVGNEETLNKKWNIALI